MGLRLAAVQLGVLCLAGASAPAIAAEDQQQVTIDLQLCEGKEFKFWFNDEADKKQAQCERPLKGVSVVAVRDADTPKPVETDANGQAHLGPIALGPGQKFRIAVACTQHRCLTLSDLFVGSGFIKEGQNKMLVVTVPNPPPAQTAPGGEGG